MEIRTTRASGVFWITVCLLALANRDADGDSSTKLKTHVVFSPHRYKKEGGGHPIEFLMPQCAAMLPQTSYDADRCQAHMSWLWNYLYNRR